MCVCVCVCVCACTVIYVPTMLSSCVEMHIFFFFLRHTLSRYTCTCMYFICAVRRFEPQGRRFVNFLYYYYHIPLRPLVLPSMLPQINNGKIDAPANAVLKGSTLVCTILPINSFHKFKHFENYILWGPDMGKPHQLL